MRRNVTFEVYKNSEDEKTDDDNTVVECLFEVEKSHIMFSKETKMFQLMDMGAFIVLHPKHTSAQKSARSSSKDGIIKIKEKF